MYITINLKNFFLYHTHSILFNLNQRAPFQTAEEFYLHSQKKRHLSTWTSIYELIHLQSGPYCKSPLFQVSIYPSVFKSLDFSVKKPPSHWRKVKKTHHQCRSGERIERLRKHIWQTDYWQTLNRVWRRMV